jgi:uncharacterized protein (TIGR02246 family)
MNSYARDRAEIADLMARYLFAMDYHDADAYAQCFAEDGVLDYAMGTLEGREAIRAEARVFRDKIAEVFKDWQGQPRSCATSSIRRRSASRATERGTPGYGGR